MAENNLLMTIVLVVAATLLFSGGLTGNVSRSSFSNLPSAPSTLLGNVCSPEKEGIVLEGGDAVIRLKNSECEWDIIADCADSSRPFITVRTGYGQEEVQCRGLAISSSTDVFPGIQ